MSAAATVTVGDTVSVSLVSMLMDDYRRDWKLANHYCELDASNCLVVFSDERCDWWEEQKRDYEKWCADNLPHTAFAWRRLFSIPMPVSSRLTADEIKERVDIVELLEQFTRLRGRGDRWMGKCPFHDDKTASFSVDVRRKLWHCFAGCGGGSVIDFVMRKYDKTFIESLDILREFLGG